MSNAIDLVAKINKGVASITKNEDGKYLLTEKKFDPFQASLGEIVELEPNVTEISSNGYIEQKEQNAIENAAIDELLGYFN